MSFGPSVRPYTSGFFQLSLDDSENTKAYLKVVDGGTPEQEVMSERFGSSLLTLQHASVAMIKDISFEIGLAGSKGVLRWIKNSWIKKFDRRSGQIDHGDFDGVVQYTQEFSNALIAETTFPALDGSSTKPGYLKVKFTPESVGEPGASGNLDVDYGRKQKLWTCDNFKFSIDGIDGMEFTNSLKEFSVKQTIKKMATGEDRFQEIMPSKIEFPTITGTIAEAYAGPLKEWATKYLYKGQRDPKAQRTGSLEFRAANGKVLFRINMFAMSLKKLGVATSQANAGDIKRLQFELHVERMDLDAELGFD